MGIWEVTKVAAGTGRNAAQSSYKGKSDIASEYAQILAEKISNIKSDVQAMETVREQLDEISDLHEELTGEVKIDEDSGNANRDDGSSTTIIEQETIKRLLPDGSIMVTTYEGSRIVEQVKHKPNMIVVPDYTAPPKPDGSPATELKPTHSLELEMLLMM